MKNKKNCILMATDSLAKPILTLLNDNFNLKLVVTAPPAKTGRGQKTKTISPIKREASKLGIPTISPAKLDQKSLEKINIQKPDFIMVFAYGKIIPIDKISTKEILNIHPSLLPKLRGPSPIRYAILEGLKETGISLMKIDQKIDHGPIIAQIKIPLTKKETYLSLRKKVKKAAPKLVKSNLESYLNKETLARPQNHQKATFTKMIKKKDGKIDWDNNPKNIEQKIRAFNPWPGAFTKVEGKILKIHSAKIVGDKLKLEEVQLEGRNKIKFEDFKRGYRGKLDFSDKII